MKRAALYIRVSTEEQAKHGFSLVEQQHDLEQYAAQHGYAVIGVYAVVIATILASLIYLERAANTAVPFQNLLLSAICSFISARCLKLMKPASAFPIIGLLTTKAK